MTVAVPVEVKLTVAVENTECDLFDDCPQSHAAHVANSCTWCDRWVTDRCIHENMALTHAFLQNNTDEALWTKCLDLCEECEPIQQGGPLVAFLILQRIQNSSEQALDLLKGQITELEISKIQGEDVEQVVGLIESTHRVLKCSSTKSRACVPQDFSKTVLQVCQTSSVPEFDSTFARWQMELQMTADRTGTHPVWPSASEVNALATNSHRRLKSAGAWDDAVKNPSGACPAQCLPVTASSPGEVTLKCWNCGGDHHLEHCPDEHDDAKIEANRDKFHKSTGRHPPRRRKVGTDGRPLIRNKKGLWVVDTQRCQAVLGETTPVALWPRRR